MSTIGVYHMQIDRVVKDEPFQPMTFKVLIESQEELDALRVSFDLHHYEINLKYGSARTLWMRILRGLCHESYRKQQK